MASNWRSVRIYVIAHDKDFIREREILQNEVFTDLKTWCELRKCELILEVVKTEEPQIGVQNISEVPGSEAYYVCLLNNSVKPSQFKDLPPGEPPPPSLNEAFQHLNNVLILVRRDDNLPDFLSEDEHLEYVKDSYNLTEIPACEHLDFEEVPHVMNYQYDYVEWDRKTNLLQGELGSTFKQQIIEYFKEKISQTDRLVNGPSHEDNQSMEEAQRAFVHMTNPKVKGRVDLVMEIEEYIFKGDQDIPFLLLGEAGSGKSCTLAKTAFCLEERLKQHEQCKTASKGCEWQLFYHFVGAVPGSTELAGMLRQLLLKLDIVSPANLPRDLDSAAQLTCNTLANGNGGPLILLVDAVNQFDEEPASQVISWLPRKLGPNVRVVLSMISQSSQHKVLQAREPPPRETCIKPLDVESRKEIVQEALSACGEKLSQQEMNLLLAKPSSSNPLWLSVACQQLQGLADWKLVASWIRNLPEGLPDLMEGVLSQLEQETGSMLAATVCLLEASASGLRECELLAILTAEQELSTSSVYEEKDEKESSEKESNKKHYSEVEGRWRHVYAALQPYLRPYGDSREGRLDFYHRALSKAVRRKYFKVSEDVESSEESHNIFLFWHKKLADYFQDCDSVDRKVEEYLYQLSRLCDADRLSRCLCEWPVFDRLYSEEFSPKLINYWRKAGGIDEMMFNYQASLSQLEHQSPSDENRTATYYEKVARVLLQAGKYSESLDLARVALKMEERELGNRPERMVELYYLMAEIYDEKLKLNDFVSVSQLPDLRKTISYGKKSIELRKNMEGEYHRFKYGMSLMRLAFSLESWEACGGDSTMSAAEAIAQGNQHIDKAIDIFKELKDDGHYAEALMTKGVLAKRGSSEQLKFYNEAKEMCVQLYGEHHILASRLYINIGIVYEDRGDYVRAYEYFKDWARVSESVLGSDHPKTLRAKGVLREPRYQLIAQRLKERQERGDQNQEQSLNNDAINEEADDVTPASLQNLIEEYTNEGDPEHLNNLIFSNDNVNNENEINETHGQSLLAAAEALSQALGEILEAARSGDENDIEELRNLMNNALNRIPGHGAEGHELEGREADGGRDSPDGQEDPSDHHNDVAPSSGQDDHDNNEHEPPDNSEHG